MKKRPHHGAVPNGRTQLTLGTQWNFRSRSRLSRNNLRMAELHRYVRRNDGVLNSNRMNEYPVFTANICDFNSPHRQ